MKSTVMAQACISMLLFVAHAPANPAASSADALPNYFMMDSHHCSRRVVKIDGKDVVRNEGNFGSKLSEPFPISYRSIVPKQAECENLLVPVCLSATHVAYGSIRMDPVFMILAQSAGTAAAMAIDGDANVQAVPYDKLRERLLADGQKLD